ncbi:SMP-30/gluconolactonase/LRE family protein [Pedobacter sp. ASV1-7]|uniref:SMP-30/gluconolactonase/LRE family protein n=1 Tax=Pedobacter sp. ASV1-7 TaxID=3145237 RepID=UPI0032E8D514
MPNQLSSSSTLKAQLVLDTQSILGEGAIWNYADQKLYWVDIDQHLLHQLNPLNNLHQTTYLPKKITTVVPTINGELLVALEDGVYSYNKSTSELQLRHVNPENNLTGNRFNDGKCDPAGRFWVGTMGKERSAALYCMNADYILQTMQTGITNSNGILWSLDQKTMYYIDTPTCKVSAYDFDNNTGQLSNPRSVITIPINMGRPDGATIDSEGMIWIAMWGGYCVTRWNPKTGELLSKIEVPSKNITSCAFGGEKLDTLYITSAKGQISDSDLSDYPNSGGLFAVKPGINGIKSNFFAG